MRQKKSEINNIKSEVIVFDLTEPLLKFAS